MRRAKRYTYQTLSSPTTSLPPSPLHPHPSLTHSLLRHLPPPPFPPPLFLRIIFALFLLSISPSHLVLSNSPAFTLALAFAFTPAPSPTPVLRAPFSALRLSPNSVSSSAYLSPSIHTIHTIPSSPSLLSSSPLPACRHLHSTLPTLCAFLPCTQRECNHHIVCLGPPRMCQYPHVAPIHQWYLCAT